MILVGIRADLSSHIQACCNAQVSLAILGFVGLNMDDEPGYFRHITF